MWFCVVVYFCSSNFCRYLIGNKREIKNKQSLEVETKLWISCQYQYLTIHNQCIPNENYCRKALSATIEICFACIKFFFIVITVVVFFVSIFAIICSNCFLFCRLKFQDHWIESHETIENYLMNPESNRLCMVNKTKRKKKKQSADNKILQLRLLFENWIWTHSIGWRAFIKSFFCFFFFLNGPKHGKTGVLWRKCKQWHDAFGPLPTEWRRIAVYVIQSIINFLIVY